MMLVVFFFFFIAIFFTSHGFSVRGFLFYKSVTNTLKRKLIQGTAEQSDIKN